MNIKELQRIFSERLRELMFDRGLSNISDLAKQINIPRTTISNWVNEVRSPQIDSLVLVADFFGVSIDYLLGREN